MKELLKRCLSWILILIMFIPLFTAISSVQDAETVEASTTKTRKIKCPDLMGDNKKYDANDIYNAIGESNMVFTSNKDQESIYFGYKVKQHSSGSSHVYSSIAIHFIVSSNNTTDTIEVTMKKPLKDDDNTYIKKVLEDTKVEDNVTKEIGIYKLKYEDLSKACYDMAKKKDKEDIWEKIFNDKKNSQTIYVDAYAAMITTPINSSGTYEPAVSSCTQNDDKYEVIYSNSSKVCKLWKPEGKNSFINTWNNLNGRGNTIEANYEWKGKKIINAYYEFRAESENFKNASIECYTSTNKKLDNGEKEIDGKVYTYLKSLTSETGCTERSVCYGNIYGNTGSIGQNSLITVKFSSKGKYSFEWKNKNKKSENAKTKDEGNYKGKSAVIQPKETIATLVEDFGCDKNAGDTYDLIINGKEDNPQIQYYEYDGNDYVRINNEDYYIDQNTANFTPLTYEQLGCSIDDSSVSFAGWSNYKQLTASTVTTTNMVGSTIAMSSDWVQTDIEDDNIIKLYATFQNKAYRVTLIHDLQSNMVDCNQNYYKLSDSNETVITNDGTKKSAFYEIYGHNDGLSKIETTGLSLNPEDFSGVDIKEKISSLNNVASFNTQQVSVLNTSGMTTGDWTDWYNVFKFEGYYTERNGNGTCVIDSKGNIDKDYFGENCTNLTHDIYLYSFFSVKGIDDVKPPEDENSAYFGITYDGIVHEGFNNRISYGQTISYFTGSNVNGSFTFDSFRQLYYLDGNNKYPIFVKGIYTNLPTANGASTQYTYTTNLIKTVNNTFTISSAKENLTTISGSSNYINQSSGVITPRLYNENRNVALFSYWKDSNKPIIGIGGSVTEAEGQDYNNGWYKSKGDNFYLTFNFTDNESGLSKYGYTITKYKISDWNNSAEEGKTGRTLTSKTTSDYTTNTATNSTLNGKSIRYATDSTGAELKNGSKTITFNSDGIYVIDVEAIDNADQVDTDGSILNDQKIYISNTVHKTAKHIVIKIDTTAPSGSIVTSRNSDGNWIPGLAVTDDAVITDSKQE